MNAKMNENVIHFILNLTKVKDELNSDISYGFQYITKF